MIGQGLVSCVAAWNVAKPQVVVMHGAVTDNNATLVRPGLQLGAATRYFTVGQVDRQWLNTRRTPGTRPRLPPSSRRRTRRTRPSTPRSIPNDETGAPIITYLKTHGVSPEDVPDHGAGRHADRSAEHPRPATSAGRSTSPSTLRRRPLLLWPCTCGPADSSGRAGQRDHGGHDGQLAGAVRPADAGVGHDRAT